MNLSLFCAALRRRPVSLTCTVLVLVASSSLVGAPVALACAVWLAAAAVALELWYVLEGPMLWRRGFRGASCDERARFGAALACNHLAVLVLDEADVWLGRGLHSVVITRALLDVLEDRALGGILHQTASPAHRAAVAGRIAVWLGTLPITTVWWATRGLLLLGRVLALIVGMALVLPMVLWPDGFVRWAGRVFGGAMVALVGSALLSNGLAAAGAGLLLAWAIVPGLRVVLAWETRRTERIADQATIAAGLGPELLEALDALAAAAPLPAPRGLLSVLCPVGDHVTSRADRLRAALARG